MFDGCMHEFMTDSIRTRRQKRIIIQSGFRPALYPELSITEAKYI